MNSIDYQVSLYARRMLYVMMNEQHRLLSFKIAMLRLVRGRLPSSSILPVGSYYAINDLDVWH